MRLVSFCLLLASLASAQALTLELKPGTAIPTLAAARDAARQARGANPKEPIIVRVSDGVYPFTEAVIFEPVDSGVAYEAAPGAKPVFTGGRKVTGWKAGADGLWTAHVEPGTSYEALWVNGRRATRARFPKNEFDQATGQPLQALPGLPLAGPPQQTMLQIDPKDAAILRGLRPRGIARRQRRGPAFVERDATSAGRRARGGWHAAVHRRRPQNNLFPSSRFIASTSENLRAALTDPGEWHLARNGTLTLQVAPRRNAGDGRRLDAGGHAVAAHPR